MKKLIITTTEAGYFIEHEFFFGCDLIRNAKFIPTPNGEVLKLLQELQKFVSHEE